MRFILTIAAIVAVSACPAVAQNYTKPVGDIISRVQTNLNRVAHGLPAIDGDKATTSVDRLVEIFSDLLNGTSQRQADARELLDDLQRSIEVSFDARQINEPFPHLAKAMEDVKRRAKEEETLSPIDMALKKVVIVAYQALLMESYDYWSSWRNDLRGAIRLPCNITYRLKGPLEFSSPHLRATLGEVTTCPLVGRFNPHERRLVTEDELILLVEMQRDVVEERQRSGEVDPAVPAFRLTRS
ncbi:MAG: hypothetical protein HC844_16160 [Tabrizicola sp.]|nr:hypothetical protein [Tabrizicola sp.]